MKLKHVIVLVLFVGLMVGIYQFRQWRENEMVRSLAGFELSDVSAKPKKSETTDETLIRFRTEADQLARNYVSNSVVGFRRLRFISMDTMSQVVTNWRGWAESEFINKLGGVELTTTYFQFSTGRSGKILYCDTDLDKALDNLRGAFWIGVGITNRPPSGWPDPTRN